MNFRALALDLDGTLTNSEKIITPRTKEAIFAAMEIGVKIVLASGRPVLGIRRLAEELELYSRGGFILAYNGGQIIDCMTNDIIFERLLPMEYYGEVCEFGRRFGVNALTYDENGVVSENDTAVYVKKEAFNNSIPINKVDKLEDVVKQPVVKFMIVGEPEKISITCEHMRQRFDGEINVFLSEPYFIEVTAAGIEKSAALKVLVSHLDITREQLAACGDGLNDLSMLKYAGYSVAMENAYDEVKRIADYITLSNDDDGVAHFIEKFILK